MSYKAGTVVIDILADTTKLVSGMESAQRTAKRTSESIVKSVLTISAAYAGIEGVRSLTDQFITLENAQIGVMKTTGLTGGSFTKLDTELKKMSTTMSGFKLDGMYDIAEAAGQLGISGVKNIAEFTRVISMVGLTTELSAGDAATSFAKLSNSLGEPIDKVERLASVTNELSNNTTATVSDLLIFAQRLSGGAKTAGLTTSEILGLSATMSDLAINFETGGTNVNKVMLDILSNSNKFASALGINLDTFATMVEDKPIRALEALLNKVNSLSKTDAAKFLTDLGYNGTEVKDVLLKLSSNTALLNKNLKISRDEYKTSKSMIEEYTTASQGLEAQNEKLSNSFSILASEIGSNFKEPMIEASKYLQGVIDGVIDNKDDIADISKAIALMGGSILAVNTATKAYTVTAAAATATNALFGGSFGAANRSILLATASTKALSLATKAIPYVAVASAAYSLYEIFEASHDTMTIAERDMNNYAQSIKNASDATLDFEISKITKEIAKVRKVANEEARDRGIGAPVSGYGETLAYELTALQEQLDLLQAQKESINKVAESSKSSNIELQKTKQITTEIAEEKAKIAEKYAFEADWIASENEDILEALAMQKAALGMIEDPLDSMNEKFAEMYDEVVQFWDTDKIEAWGKAVNSAYEELGDKQKETEKYEGIGSKDWTAGLTGSAKAVANVGNAFADIGEEQSKWEKFNASNEASDTDKEKHIQNQMTGYANLAGTMANMYEEGSAANQALIAVQTALSVVTGITAIANAMASGDGYTAVARGLAVAATLASFGWAGGSGSGSGTYKTPEEIAADRTSTYDAKISDYEEASAPITNRLDRQIELLESIDGIRGTYGDSLSKEVLLAGEAFTVSMHSSALEGIGMFTDTLGSFQFIDNSAYGDYITETPVLNAGNIWSTVKLNDDLLATSTNLIDFIDKLEVNRGLFETPFHWGMLSIAPLSGTELVGLTDTEVDLIYDSFQQATNDFVTITLDGMMELISTADDFKNMVDEISGTTYYKDKGLQEAFYTVKTQTKGEDLVSYLTRNIEAIQKLEANLSDDDIALLKSQRHEDIVAQAKLAETLSTDLQNALKSGALEALNMKDSLAIVSEALAESRDNIDEWTQRNETLEETAQRLADTLGVNVNSTMEELAKGTGGLTDAELELLYAREVATEATEAVVAKSKENIAIWTQRNEESEDTLYRLAEEMGISIASAFEDLIDGLDGLTDAELEFLQARESAIDSLESQIESIEASNLSISKKMQEEILGSLSYLDSIEKEAYARDIYSTATTSEARVSNARTVAELSLSNSRSKDEYVVDFKNYMQELENTKDTTTLGDVVVKLDEVVGKLDAIENSNSTDSVYA